ncbi:class II fructose-bisphosphate aldolase [Streptomyces sp. NPDC051020]|uniref:class II fructose-bisphosphate aldolase n=1 Tax=Streptomyces sp. NPDC051020 TaxID=3155409 RepID=UPI00343B360F
MTLAAIGPMLSDGRAHHRPVAAFDAHTFEHLQAIVAGAELAGSGVIIQIGETAVDHHGGHLAPLARAAAEMARTATVPIGLHLTKVRRTALLAQAAHCGFGSIMYDAGHLSYARAVAVTRDAVSWAHEQGLWAEAEVADTGGREGPRAARTGTSPCPHGAHLAPGTAQEFADATGADALVLSGESHPFGTCTADDHRSLLTGLRAAVNVPLVLRELSAANPEELRAAVVADVAKLGFGRALDPAMTRALRDGLAAGGTQDPAACLAAARRAMADVVARLIQTLEGPDTGPSPCSPAAQHHAGRH